MYFKDLKLIPQLLRALDQQGYQQPTPIQARSIPHLLEGKDLFGCAQTGTGKTAAFCIPMLQQLVHHKRDTARRTRALILAPTRELAIQIGESLQVYGRHLRLKHTVIYGGVSHRPQIQAFQQGVDIIVATPGRLLEHIDLGHVRLDHIEQLVLDEADRMLDMGFIHDIRRIIREVPQQRQTIMFSATLPKEIRSLVARLLKDPVHVEVKTGQHAADTVDQNMYFVDKANKRHLLAHILREGIVESALIFTRTKYSADRLAKVLNQKNIPAKAIHGNKSQGQRQNTLRDFKSKKLKVLVATDVASRGIDVDELSHVINFDLPATPETYVHRIGRTGRAGATGVALSFCGKEELSLLKDIHRYLKKDIPVVSDHPYLKVVPSAENEARKAAAGKRRYRSGNKSGNFKRFRRRKTA